MDPAEKVAGYLRALTAYPDRHVGSDGNRAATALFAETVAAFGFEVHRRDFDCIEWEYGDASLTTSRGDVALNVGPYSLPVDRKGVLVAASTADEIERLGDGRNEPVVLLLHGHVAAGQLMPKNFVWYNPEEHARIYRAIEALAPLAVLAATGRDPELVGSQYPFPLFEDGDFDVPNAYLTDAEGVRLLTHAGERVGVHIDSTRVPTTAEHVVAVLPGSGTGRIVVSAHIDSRKGSPGALDNASGVATVLLLAELLSASDLKHTIELAPFNGEDNYANPGEMLWAAENSGRMNDIALGINIDDSGQAGSRNSVSFYGCPDEVVRTVAERMAAHEGLEEGSQWFQGDHMILVQAGRPSIAVASSSMESFMAEYAHTERDTTDLADPALIAETAEFLCDVVHGLSDLL